MKIAEVLMAGMVDFFLNRSTRKDLLIMLTYTEKIRSEAQA